MTSHSKIITNETNLESMDSNWKGLYKISGAVALILLVYSFETMVILIAIGGQPKTA
jgi:hypothetical protein